MPLAAAGRSTSWARSCWHPGANPATPWNTCGVNGSSSCTPCGPRRQRRQVPFIRCQGPACRIRRTLHRRAPRRPHRDHQHPRLAPPRRPIRHGNPRGRLLPGLPSRCWPSRRSRCPSGDGADSPRTAVAGSPTYAPGRAAGVHALVGLRCRAGLAVVTAVAEVCGLLARSRCARSAGPRSGCLLSAGGVAGQVGEQVAVAKVQGQLDRWSVKTGSEPAQRVFVEDDESVVGPGNEGEGDPGGAERFGFGLQFQPPPSLADPDLAGVLEGQRSQSPRKRSAAPTVGQ